MKNKKKVNFPVFHLPYFFICVSVSILMNTNWPQMIGSFRYHKNNQEEKKTRNRGNQTQFGWTFFIWKYWLFFSFSILLLGFFWSIRLLGNFSEHTQLDSYWKFTFLFSWLNILYGFSVENFFLHSFIVEIYYSFSIHIH